MTTFKCHCKDSTVIDQGGHSICLDCGGIIECRFCRNPAVAYVDGEYVCDRHINEEEEL